LAFGWLEWADELPSNITLKSNCKNKFPCYSLVIAPIWRCEGHHIYIRIRLSLRESPLYAKIKEAGKTSKNPIRESFGNPYNRRMVLLALFGATAGQGVIWYTGQFYSSTFMQGILKVDFNTANLVVAAALLCGAPFFVVMGIISDRIGRKKLIMAGCLLAAICYIPIYYDNEIGRPVLESIGAESG
jgi:Na+/melibiose symporter-like transporter